MPPRVQATPVNLTPLPSASSHSASARTHTTLAHTHARTPEHAPHVRNIMIASKTERTSHKCSLGISYRERIHCCATPEGTSMMHIVFPARIQVFLHAALCAATVFSHTCGYSTRMVSKHIHVSEHMFALTAHKRRLLDESLSKSKRVLVSVSRLVSQ